MKRFLSAASCAALVSVGVLGAANAQSIEVASTFAKNQPYLGEGGEFFVSRLSELSEGRINFEIYGAGELVPPFEVFDAVSSGAVRAGWDWVGYWADRIPAVGLIGAMPFGPDPLTFMSWMWSGEGLELLQRAYEPHNVVALPCHLTAAEPAGWFNVELNNTADLQGLRFRISGLGGRVMDRLGASTSLIAGGELYVSLERGRIDGLEFSLPVVDRSIGVYQIASYYYFPGWHQPASWNSFIINRDVWDGYSEHDQELFWAACRETVMNSLITVAADQVEVLSYFEEQGVEVRRLRVELLDALQEASREVIEEPAATDELFREVYESLRDHMEVEQVWFNLQHLPRTAAE